MCSFLGVPGSVSACDSSVGGCGFETLGFHFHYCKPVGKVLCGPLVKET